MNLLVLTRTPIFEQLQIEEALLRAGSGNWVIVNTGSTPAIVMGISSGGVHTSACLPRIRRFSGGGTVVVDEHTVFCSFIFDDCSVPCEKTPTALMDWSLDFFSPVFSPHTLVLEEHDYVLDDRKVGGNAQSFVRGRSLHHTSFLWDWDPNHMQCLMHPDREPEYRRQRPHDSFCNKLRFYFDTQELFIQTLLHHITTVFPCRKVSFSDVQYIQNIPHRKVVRHEQSVT